MHEGPFFTAIDDARLKGSRDPLGFEVIWTALGREIIGNLTTVTRSVRQFSTLLYGFHFANQATESLPDRDEQFLPAFLRFEQLAGYARYHKYRDQEVGGDIRGIRAVQRNVNERPRDLRLSPNPKWSILSDQKTYGLYGLFRVAAYNSGWLHKERQTLLSEKAQEFVAQQLQLQRIPPQVQSLIIDDIARDSKLDLNDSRVVDRVADLLAPKLSDTEKPFYGSHLVRGDYLLERLDTQSQLWECIEAVNSRSKGFRWRDEFGMVELRACIEEAAARGDSELAANLDRICRAEELLGAAATVYDYLLTRADQPMNSVADEISRKLGKRLDWLNVDDLKPKFGASGERLVGLAERLACGEYAEACHTLIEQNKAVMDQRDGSAWIVLKGDRLDVRVPAEDRDLPTRKDIRSFWVHTYFLNALKRVGACVYHGLVGGGEDGTG